MEFANSENLMWNVKTSTPNSVPADCYDATMMYMRHIGDTLELSAKLEINELYAITKISQNESFDYKNICKTSFGVNINNLLAKEKLLHVLKTFPIDIKLSDWRNIAYHHTYYVDGKEITCYYGKANKSFCITIDELRSYVAQIITSCNTIDIARRIFVFDNMESLASKIDNLQTPKDRVPMIISQLNTTFLTQGFLIVDYNVSTIASEIVLRDLKNDGSLSEEEIRMRKIHSSQFLYPLWCKLPNNTLRMQYCNNDKVITFAASIQDEVCEKIANGVRGLSYLAAHLTIEQGRI